MYGLLFLDKYVFIETILIIEFYVNYIEDVKFIEKRRFPEESVVNGYRGFIIESH